MSEADHGFNAIPSVNRVLATVLDVALSPTTACSSSPSTAILVKLAAEAVSLVAYCADILAARKAAQAPDTTAAESYALWVAYMDAMDTVAAIPVTTPVGLAAKASLILAEFQETPPATPEQIVAASLAHDVIRYAAASVGTLLQQSGSR